MDRPEEPVNVLSLCSGGAGLDAGLELAVEAARVVCWVEWEAFAVAELVRRMETGELDAAPCWTDLRTFDCAPWRGVVDIVTAGFPCQPYSTAGRQLGEADPRDLWPHVARVVDGVRPEAVFLENVPALLSAKFERVARRIFADLEGMGYRVAVGLFTAADVGCTHKRERVFILADRRHADGPAERQQELEREAVAGRKHAGGCGLASLADRSGDACRRDAGAIPPEETGFRRGWPPDGDLSLGIELGRHPLGDATPVRRRQGGSLGRGGVERIRPEGGGVRPAGSGRSAAVVHADGPGCEGRGLRGGGRADERPAGQAGGPPAWEFPVHPPGPLQHAEWERVLAEVPWLAPAVESGLCGLVDGLAPVRAPILRIFGNGVVPITAAWAFTVLSAVLRQSRPVVYDNEG